MNESCIQKKIFSLYKDLILTKRKCYKGIWFNVVLVGRSVSTICLRDIAWSVQHWRYEAPPIWSANKIKDGAAYFLGGEIQGKAAVEICSAKLAQCCSHKMQHVFGWYSKLRWLKICIRSSSCTMQLYYILQLVVAYKYHHAIAGSCMCVYINYMDDHAANIN